MFCLSCYYAPQSPIVRCVESILKFHPNETVVIVDSNSPDKSYFDSFKDNDQVVILEDVNQYRHPGTFKTVYEYYPNESHYVMIHDSIVFKKSIQEFLDSDNEFYSFLYFNERMAGQGDKHLNCICEMLEGTKYTFPEPHQMIVGAFGHIGVIKHSMMKRMYDSGFLNRFISSDKFKDQQCERVLGIVASQEGYPPNEYSIEGDYLARCKQVDHDQLDYFTKIILGR